MPDANDILMSQGQDALYAHIKAAPVFRPKNGAAVNSVQQGPWPTNQPQQPEKPPFKPPVVHDAAHFLANEAPQREWLVDGWIPWREVTLLAADGGTGKTLLSLMLGYATAYGTQWLGMDAKRCKAIYYGAEDDKDELHYRMAKIGQHFSVGQHERNQFELITVADQDAELATVQRCPLTGEAKLQPTDMFLWLETRIGAGDVGLLMLDASADVFGGDEVDRKAVRSFIRMLRGLCLRNNCTVVLVTHPSVDGMKSGRGYSGSTHWNNAVRSRLYMTTPTTADGDEDEHTDFREIKVMKANRGKRGTKQTLRWHNDVFVLGDSFQQNSSGMLAGMEARNVFLEILERVTEQGQYVSPKHSITYAPKVFAQREDAKGISKRAFEKAQEKLLDEGRIRIEERGPASRRYSVLVVAR